MKKAILYILITVCINNYILAQIDSNKNKFDTILIKHDPGNNNKNKNPDSTNERKKKPPVQKTDLTTGNSSRKNQAIIN